MGEKLRRFKCQSCELEAEQTLALCELDTNWTPGLGLNTQICCFKSINLTLVAQLLCKYSFNACLFTFLAYKLDIKVVEKVKIYQ